MKAKDIEGKRIQRSQSMGQQGRFCLSVCLCLFLSLSLSLSQLLLVSFVFPPFFFFFKHFCACFEEEYEEESNEVEQKATKERLRGPFDV